MFGTLIGCVAAALVVGAVTGDLSGVLRDPISWVLLVGGLVIAHFEGRRGRQ